MIKRSTYRVADHLFLLDFKTGLLPEERLSNYLPFQTEIRSGETSVFSLSFTEEITSSVPEGERIADLNDENGRMLLFSNPEGKICIRLFSPLGMECCRIMMTRDYRMAAAEVDGSTAERRYAVDTAVMLLYAFSTSSQSTLLLHASALECGGRGYLFLGKSGTGKSTHSQLWLENIEGTILLNDDNPVVRVSKGEARVYGSPWSGKTPCYVDRCLPLGAIVRLRQSSRNNISSLAGVRAYAAVLPSVSCLKWDSVMADNVHDSIYNLIEETPVFSLECRPDGDAARLCHAIITSSRDE